MRKASVEMLTSKLKADKDRKKMTVKLKAQKATSTAENAVVIERRRKTCERKKKRGSVRCDCAIGKRSKKEYAWSLVFTTHAKQN
jgi:hypothetical protein